VNHLAAGIQPFAVTQGTALLNRSPSSGTPATRFTNTHAIPAHEFPIVNVRSDTLEAELGPNRSPCARSNSHLFNTHRYQLLRVALQHKVFHLDAG
jgi:hypothetical protein